MAMVKCRVCGIEFESIRSTAKFCSDECRRVYYQLKYGDKYRKKKEATTKKRPRTKWGRSDEAICWKCAKAGGKDSECPWASGFKPVPGWKAEASEQYADGYRVKECPLFKEG